MKFTPPAWLKTAKLVCHTPDKTIFEPQRRIRQHNGYPHLLDCNDQLYPLAHCELLRLAHLQGSVAWLVTESTQVSVIGRGNRLEVSDGTNRCFVVVPDEGEAAANALAQMFNGHVYTPGEDDAEAA